MNDLLKEIQRLKRENLKLKRQLEAIRKIIFVIKEIKEPKQEAEEKEKITTACTSENP
jgi:hypothetical protein